ncbi:FERM, ARHGEF and pleckstrin domain-containing protein 1 isoform X2 [Chrysoperla carnea]|nr:FERM, ARHGEF and pleckstrin domain-containing protein 1 isoform X2 [Chrysoperla carnea]XP_044743913.1 FERM, ARHGEF and pleckstrin domain-containing protein 1 isoform X2 [Chrysoperla carnea]
MSRNRMMDSQRACSTGELTTDGCGLVGSGRTMHHSHSTPAGVDGGARTPPATPKKGGKMLAVRVQMLDDSITMFQIQAKALGRVLFDQVCKQLHLLEADYFGLEYQDLAGTRYWLDLQKPVSRQLGLSLIDPLLRFCVKFYTPDPGQLEEEFTRYLFCLQIKRDLSQAHLQCNDNTAALMASYIVQAECGDYVAEDYPDHTYLSSYKFVPHQDHELECRIMENHKKHAGQSPAEADLNLLETARRCELYGMKMHPAKDHDGITLNLSVAHMGIVVFQHFSKINTFSWAKIRKISFKRKRFLIKLHPESYGVYKDLVEFYFEGRNECKNFWKKCVEHHGFFRCAVVKNISRHKTRVISRGSSFRYSGKTQKQMVEFVRDNYVKRQTFQRSASFRHSAHSSAVNVHAVSVGTSISAHPLLPLADPSLAEELDKASRMESARAGRGASQTTRSAYRRQGTATHSPRSSITLGTPTPDSPTVLVEDTTVTTSSPSPPLTTQSVSVEICTSTSRVHDAKSRGVYRDEDIDNSTEKPDKENLENVSSQNNNNSLYNISSNSTSPTSPDLQQPTTTVLNNSVNNNINGNHVDENGKKKYRWPTDKSFFIAKEILMTEKIYKKDLDVINEYWRNEFGTEEMEEVAELLLSLVSPLATVHAVFARDLDSCLQGWENHTLPLGDILLNNIPTLLPLYEEYLDGHTLVLEQLDIAFRRNPRFEQLYRDFELQKVCYLPFTSFILKPLHRLLQYQNLIDRLLESYDENRSDRASCIAARAALTPLLSPAKETLKHSENLATLHELQRDIVGFDILGTPGRNFLRLGCLLKHSRKGYQQRMFFLFSDILLYTSRVQGAAHFRVHGHMPLRGVMIDEPEKALAKYAFTIYGGNRALTVAANSQYEKDCWVTDLQDALQKARDHTDSNLTYLSLKSCCSSDEIIDKQGLDGCSSTERPSMPLQRNNTTVQVCWHRNTTISMVDQLLSIKNQLSGYLLRKFKNSNGWQKLWVVFTSFCLFFYKSSTEDFPLASLPVLGYTIGTPSPSDNISKEFVFKLQYKNHVYFFRSESNYTFQRWLEVIGSATNRSVEQNGNELTQGF